ncbi:uncharacterized protein MELLADRAFT_79270 [Melampsora larici-populina 98AG31]|uniref:Uncharacterized protein n=1 Tax=Melampsora larici-populina (strain 98AG31 / pathotype 3-4-7) TaxID=747676 RepID=F4S4Y0_MELLP|nr:uncharacterized protein MELLADRAFT_79270 [Melampsora larici-populina 98AG31]EGG00303.1 hypothetical protein MELLADRAFT_79270 [Melampsora larici-populina 98AG31]
MSGSQRNHPQINLSGSDDDDDFGTPSMRLKRTNWYDWKFRLEMYLASKGYEGLLDEEWTKSNLSTAEFRQRNAWASHLLRRIVSSELHSVLRFNADKSFLETFHELGKSCGVSCVVTFSMKHQELHQLRYHPGTSIREHMNKFNNLLYLVKDYMTDLPDFGTISTGMAACIFLNSFNQDQSLQPLIGSLYNSEPFNYDVVYKSMGFEADRRQLTPNSFPKSNVTTPRRSEKGRRSNNESSNQNSNRMDNKMKSDHEILVKRVDKLEKIMKSHLSTSK